VAVICSARSSQTKNEGTTTRLLRAAKIAETHPGSREQFKEIVTAIRDDHIHAADESIASPKLRESYRNIVDTECQSLTSILESVQEIEELSPKAENKIISKGEKLACQFLTTLLEDSGIPAQLVDLTDVIKRHKLNISTEVPERLLYAALSEAFRHEILDCASSGIGGAN